MKQNIESMIGLATARSNSNNVSNKKGPGEKPDLKEKSFHEKEMDRYDLDPQNLDYHNAVAMGKADCIAFMNNVTNIHSKSHEQDFATYRNKYHLNAQEAENDFIDKRCAAKGVRPFEKRDPGYEDTLLKKYKPTGDVTDVQSKFYKGFEDSLRQKWLRSGYQKDREHVYGFTSKYGLTQNNNIQSLKEFEPKK